MDRRKVLKHGGLAGILAAASGPAIGQTLPEVRWRLTSSFPKSLDTLWGAGENIVKRVSELTGGRFQLRYFAAGEIVPGLQVLDAVQNNTVEAGQTAMYYYFGKHPAFAFGTCLPFGMNSRQQNAWWYYGGGEQLYNDFIRSYGVYSIPYANTGCQMGGWFRKEIKSVADLKGLKFRVGGVAGMVLQRLGVVPQQIAAGDIYPALEKGAIDAAEWIGPYDDEKLGFVKVAKYYYTPGWWEPNSMGHVIVNLKAWESLPKEYQAAFATACGETNAIAMAKYDAVNPGGMRKLVSQGAQLRAFPKPVLTACYKASKEQWADWSSKYPEFKTLYESYSKFAESQHAWFKVAEQSFDNFMSNPN